MQNIDKVEGETSLLIEPVWNRNMLDKLETKPIRYLLIEPVWNRNLIPHGCAIRLLILLIEPVWNRNIPLPNRKIPI